MQLYKLLVYLYDKGTIHFIDSLIEEDKLKLESIATRRKAHNKNYVTIINSYTVESTTLF